MVLSKATTSENLLYHVRIGNTISLLQQNGGKCLKIPDHAVEIGEKRVYHEKVGTVPKRSLVQLFSRWKVCEKTRENSQIPMGNLVENVCCSRDVPMIEYRCIIAGLSYSTEYDNPGEKKEENIRLTSGAAVWRPVVIRCLPLVADP